MVAPHREALRTQRPTWWTPGVRTVHLEGDALGSGWKPEKGHPSHVGSKVFDLNSRNGWNTPVCTLQVFLGPLLEWLRGRPSPSLEQTLGEVSPCKPGESSLPPVPWPSAATRVHSRAFAHPLVYRLSLFCLPSFAFTQGHFSHASSSPDKK